MIDIMDDLKVMEEKGLVRKAIDPVTRKVSYELTRIGWLYGQYQRVLRGEFVDPDIVNELRFYVRLQRLDG